MRSVTLILLYRSGVQNGTLFYILLGVAVARLKKKTIPKTKKQKQKKTTIKHKCEIIISNDFQDFMEVEALYGKTWWSMSVFLVLQYSLWPEDTVS